MKRSIIYAMIPLAQVMKELQTNIDRKAAGLSWSDKAAEACEIDRRLLDWERHLPAFLQWNTLTLRDPEWAMKQKVILELSMPSSIRST